MVVSMGTIGRPSSGNAAVDFFRNLGRPNVATSVTSAEKTIAPIVRAPSAPLIAPKPLAVRPVVAPSSVPTTTPKVVITSPAMEKSTASPFPSASSSSSSLVTSSDPQVIDVPGYVISADAPFSDDLEVERGVSMFREPESEAPVKSSAVVRAPSSDAKIPTWVFAVGGALVLGAVGFVALKGMR